MCFVLIVLRCVLFFVLLWQIYILVCVVPVAPWQGTYLCDCCFCSSPAKYYNCALMHMGVENDITCSFCTKERDAINHFFF